MLARSRLPSQLPIDPRQHHREEREQQQSEREHRRRGGQDGPLGAAQGDQGTRGNPLMDTGGLIDAPLDRREPRIDLVGVDRQHALGVAVIDGDEHPIDGAEIVSLHVEQSTDQRAVGRPTRRGDLPKRCLELSRSAVVVDPDLAGGLEPIFALQRLLLADREPRPLIGIRERRRGASTLGRTVGPQRRANPERGQQHQHAGQAGERKSKAQTVHVITQAGVTLERPTSRSSPRRPGPGTAGRPWSVARGASSTRPHGRLRPGKGTATHRERGHGIRRNRDGMVMAVGAGNRRTPRPCRVPNDEHGSHLRGSALPLLIGSRRGRLSPAAAGPSRHRPASVWRLPTGAHDPTTRAGPRRASDSPSRSASGGAGAEGAGFEPADELPRLRFSRPVH